MTEVLVVLAALAAFGVCALMTTVGLIRWRLRRHNRIDPKQPSPAPLRWLASPSEPARLHRRLRTVARVGMVNPEIDDHTTAEILVVATRLDNQTVLAACGSGRERRHHLRTVRTEVVQLEQLTGRLARPLTGPEGRREIDTLALLADARDEVEQLDQAGHHELT
jgi:hypothetical protein